MQQIKSLNKIPNDWDDELRKNGISFNLLKPINKLLSFQQAGKKYILPCRISIRLLNCAVFQIQKLLYLGKIHITNQA